MGINLYYKSQFKLGLRFFLKIKKKILKKAKTWVILCKTRLVTFDTINSLQNKKKSDISNAMWRYT